MKHSSQLLGRVMFPVTISTIFLEDIVLCAMRVYPEWFVGKLHIICQQANNWPLSIDILVTNLLTEYSH